MTNENVVQLTTTAGEIVIELKPADAPETTKNFVRYVRDGFYDGTIFHRVIDGFMIQGGGFEPGMNQKSTRSPVKNEADNRISNKKGTVAMARTSDPHSASAQFFINCNDNDFLDFKSPDKTGYGYCVFGEVIRGMEIVSQIEETRTTTRDGHSDVPVEDVVIERAEVVGD